jgi:hypothetical protein
MDEPRRCFLVTHPLAAALDELALGSVNVMTGLLRRLFESRDSACFLQRARAPALGSVHVTSGLRRRLFESRDSARFFSEEVTCFQLSHA